MKRAIIYTRFSPRPNAKECDSCESQYERCKIYCAKANLCCQGIFHEKNVSGSILNRPKLTDALERIKLGTVLVVDSSDRLARDMLVNLTIRHQVEQAGATIEFADGSPQDTTPEGKLFQNILAAFAAYERDRIKLRTREGLAKKKAEGQWLGKPPVGCRVDPETRQLIEDEYEQITIRKALRLHNVGFSSKEIAHFLTCDFGNFRGNPWSARTVRKILKNAKENA